MLDIGNFEITSLICQEIYIQIHVIIFKIQDQTQHLYIIIERLSWER